MSRRTAIGVALLLLPGALAGCGGIAAAIADDTPLTFPEQPLRRTADEQAFDVDGDGRVDFALRRAADGRFDHLLYDDDQDGHFDREIDRGDFDQRRLPHLIVLVDSIPLRVAAERHAQGLGGWFHAPVRVVPPFPSMSVVSFAELLGAPPMKAAVERYLDLGTGVVENQMVARAFGYEHPWHLRLSWYLRDYLSVGATYVAPDAWIAHEIGRIKQTFDASPQQVVVCYVSASSGMLSVHGHAGAERSMQLLEQLCLQLLYERQGALDITLVSDHGHNFARSQRIDVEAWLAEAGFDVGDEVRDDDDVFVELDGLVTYFGVHTRQPPAVIDSVLAHDEIELATWLDGDLVMVRDRFGAACVERRGDRLRYTPIDRDVLGLVPVLDELRRAGAVDAAGFVADRSWLLATCEGAWPDAPRRLWDAFHGQVVYPSRVMFTVRDGWYAGMAVFDPLIDMASTHGGLNDINSDAMLLTTVDGVSGPLRAREVLSRVEPRYDPQRLALRVVE